VVKRIESPTEALPKSDVSRILADTARAVKVMKASWLRVALNLKQIRKHELWRETSPPCSSYEDYAYGVLKLNRGVERRMFAAMEYTEERRPRFIEEFEERGDSLDVPSYEAVNQLRSVEDRFKDRPDEWKSLESMVYEDGAGRVVLKREIDERLGRSREGAGPSERPASDTFQAVIEDLRAIAGRLQSLKASRTAMKHCFDLLDLLQREARGSKASEKDVDAPPAKARDPARSSGEEDPPW
jgi:hypothetical protein